MDGIVGIYSPGDFDLVDKIIRATGAIQHRGRDSAGIAIGNSRTIFPPHAILGRINDLPKSDIIVSYEHHNPVAAIGNVGYTKNEIPQDINAEPIEVTARAGSEYKLIITMDGHLVKYDDLKSELEPDYKLRTSNMTELVGALLHKYITKAGISFEAGRMLVDKLHGRGSFALTALVHKGKETQLIALNDDTAFEPFCYGTIDDAFVVSSESQSHRRLRGFISREYNGAEMTICSSKGRNTARVREEKITPDAFQAVYFGHPGSIFRGKEIFQIRKELGLELVNKYGVPPVDIVIPNPDSGWSVTMGVFEGFVSRLQKESVDFSKYDNEGIIKVKDKGKFEQLLKLKTVYSAVVKQAQAGRTFQEARPDVRSTATELKFGCIDTLLDGKYVVMPDDSIVRGSVTEGGSVGMVRNSNAKFFEFWVSYGPMLFPSFKEWHRGRECIQELAAQRAFRNDSPYNKTVEEANEAVAKLIKADKVRYNPPKTVKRVIGPASYQALDASYPVSYEFWPDWLKAEADMFSKFHG